MLDNHDMIILSLVVASRLLIPLLIPRYPLPAILAALVLDAADQTIFQLTDVPLAGYQSYDKALDVYYLSIAYVSTLRNWESYSAFQVGRLLFYWRLVGVALFEFSGLRYLLLIFPNAFEYFFIFYETYRSYWDSKKFSMRFAIGAAAVIWIVIKLPQEWWIHIARLDTTDLMQLAFVRLSASATQRNILAANLWLMPELVGILALVVVIQQRLIRRLPSSNRRLRLCADALQPAFSELQARTAFAAEARRIIDHALIEKVVLVTLLSLIFAEVLPGVQPGPWQLVWGVSATVVVNTILIHLLARQGVSRLSGIQHFSATLVINALLFAIFLVQPFDLGAAISPASAASFVLLLTLILTLYDEFRQVHLMRFGDGRSWTYGYGPAPP